MTRTRIVLAFLITPLFAPLAALIAGGVYYGLMAAIWNIPNVLLSYGIVAYTATVVFGLPAFLLLRAFRCGGRVIASICGGAIALFVAVILFAIVPGGYSERELAIGYSSYTFVGAVSGLVFWLIAFGIRRGGIEQSR